jgi:hemerythrin-like metal-binding protein
MALIHWQDSFALGIPDVDHEHKALIDLINRLHDAISKTPHPDDIAEFLAELHASVAGHFALEENVMRQAGYEQLAAHKAEHEQLLDQIRDIMDDHLMPQGADYEATLAERLRHWFERHFRDADRRLHDVLQHPPRPAGRGP